MPAQVSQKKAQRSEQPPISSCRTGEPILGWSSGRGAAWQGDGNTLRTLKNTAAIQQPAIRFAFTVWGTLSGTLFAEAVEDDFVISYLKS